MKRSPAGILESVVQLTHASERDALVHSLAVTLRNLLEAERVSVFWVDHEGDEARVWPVVTAERGREPVDHTLEIKYAPLELAADQDFSLCYTMRAYVSHSTDVPGRMRHVHPIIGVDSVVGLLEIIGRDYGEGEAKLPCGFLQVYRNYARVIDESERDNLTGLLNRRTFDKTMGRLLGDANMEAAKKSRGHKTPQRRKMEREQGRWLAVVDVDFFKRINDKFGHLYGDEVLLLLAGIMRRTFRANDRLFRFGGEEFVVTLEPTDELGVSTVLERFRQAVEAYSFPQVGKVTVSVGYSRINAGEAPPTIFGHADEALYYAKNHGRNRVCCYEELVAGGEIVSQAMNSEAELF